MGRSVVFSEIMTSQQRPDWPTEVKKKNMWVPQKKRNPIKRARRTGLRLFEVYVKYQCRQASEGTLEGDKFRRRQNLNMKHLNDYKFMVRHLNFILKIMRSHQRFSSEE